MDSLYLHSIRINRKIFQQFDMLTSNSDSVSMRLPDANLSSRIGIWYAFVFAGHNGLAQDVNQGRRIASCTLHYYGQSCWFLPTFMPHRVLFIALLNREPKELQTPLSTRWNPGSAAQPTS